MSLLNARKATNLQHPEHLTHTWLLHSYLAIFTSAVNVTSFLQKRTSQEVTSFAAYHVNFIKFLSTAACNWLWKSIFYNTRFYYIVQKPFACLFLHLSWFCHTYTNIFNFLWKCFSFFTRTMASFLLTDARRKQQFTKRCNRKLCSLKTHNFVCLVLELSPLSLLHVMLHSSDIRVPFGSMFITQLRHRFGITVRVFETNSHRYLFLKK